MKKTFLKRAGSVLIAAAMLLGTFAGLAPRADAAGATLGYWPEPLEIPNEYYYENQTLQPYGSCFQIDELKNWSPDNDPDARYNRGSIPLRDRWMGPNVNPLASRDAKVMPLAMANARASQAPSQGGDGVSAYVFNNFQYVTNFNFWGGASGEGPIAIPSAELIDAGHRNGVPVTGTIFLPWGDSTYGNQFVKEMVEKDANGRFPAADKLIEIAQYYGFDGYIFNAESGTGVAGFKEFLAYIQENKPDNFFITWYNGSGSLSTGSIKSWMQDGDTRITDEWWLDMSGGGYVDSTIQAAQEMGVDPWNIYSTWEYWPMSGMSGTKGGNYQTRLDEDGILKCSLGILAPTCTLTQAVDADDFMNNQDQKMWVGPSFDPSSTARPANEFCGFASMVADKTPVLGTDFVTNFTAGNGYKFYENGKVVGKENGWFNRSLTDVLPTWRWIIDSEGSMKLSAKIDYEDAWYAGTSMKIYGTMLANQANHVKLYSSQLEITDHTKFSITYKTPKAGVDVSLGLCFGDTYDDANFKFYPLTTTADGEWNTTTIDLSGDAGKTAIAISLKFNAPNGVTDYSINVGRMAFTTNNTAPKATASVTLDEAIYPTDKTMEARVYWEKAEGAFMYHIYRVHTDGTREFVGATPSDAFYLGSFEKEAGETACNFEIVSYSENGVKGETKSFSIDWPAEVENGFVPVFNEGPNLALKQPVISSVSCVADGPVHQLNDGTVLNGSKWCSQSTRGYAVIDLGENKTIQRWVVYHANCPGAGESKDMNTVDFDLQYAPDDGGALLDPNDSNTVRRVQYLNYTVADSVFNNKQDVTDRNLDQPITARYLKLNVTDSDNSAWSAIRIYEFEAYENPAISNTASPYERNVSVKNNVGAKDTVVVDNVIMNYSSGTYSDGNGVFHADTGKVRLFTSLDATEPFAVVNAVQPNESYKQRGVGIATFENLDLDANGGRLYYDVLDGSGTEVTNSRRASVYYAPETGTPSTAPLMVLLNRTTGGVQLRKQYATLFANGLEEGATIKIFASADALSPILHTQPAKADGIIKQSRVPLNKDGGTLYYEVHQEGKPDSERYALTYGDPMEMTADVRGLNELITKCSAISEADCTSGTWSAFATALTSARSTAAGVPNAAAAEEARAALAKAYASLRFKGNSQRLDELCKEYETAHPANRYTAASFATFRAALNNAKNAIAADDSSRAEYEQLRIQLEAAVRGLVEGSGAVMSVTVTPAEVSLEKGGSGFAFTAEVTGNGDVSQEVTWSVSGNEHEFTQMVGNLLYVGPDETAKTLTVTATSVTDPTVFGTATVTVIGNGGTGPVDPVDPDVNVALDAEVIAYNGNNLGDDSGPEKLFDGKMKDEHKDKWCVDGQNMWVAFDIGKAMNFGKAVLYHAGSNNEWSPSVGAINTEAYELYTLDTSKISVEELLAKTFDERTTLLADNSYWTLIGSKTGNKEDITTEEFDIQNARIFKINISDTDSTGWGQCVRVYELELYATGAVEPPVPEVEIKVDPSEMTVDSNPGQKGQFTAVVTGTDNVEVTWSISGNTSDGTLIENGQLFLGKDETAKTLTVTATSVADPTKSASATVTITPATPTVDKTALQSELNKYELCAVSQGSLTANTWAAYTEAYNAGKLVNENAAATQTEVDAATQALKDAYYALTVRASQEDLDALQALIDQAEALTESDYTPETWEALQTALTAAKALVETPENADSTAVATAKTNLQTAIDGLEKQTTAVDKSNLLTWLQYYAYVANTESNYTRDSWAIWVASYEAAQPVYDDPNATQEEVDAAAERMADAWYNSLVMCVTSANRTTLQDLIAQAEALKESDYASGWEALQTALTAAKSIVANADNTPDDDAVQAIANLQTAIDGLVKVTVDKTALNELIAGVDANVEAGAENSYTAASWKALTDALEAARTVLRNASATQEQVDAAKAGLQTAIDALAEAGDATELKAMLETAGKLDLSAVTEESAEAIRTAMENAQKAIDARDTQAALDAAAAALDEAVKNAEQKPVDPTDPDPTDPQPTQPVDPDTPHTGDRMEIMLPLLAVVALGAMAAIVLLLKKRRTV